MSRAAKLPVARRGEIVDDYHGTRIVDPYRWLEDPDSEETRAWVAAENEATERFLSTIPERENIRTRLTTLWNYAKEGVPFEHGGRYFVFRNEGLQAQPVLYVRAAPTDNGNVLIDPNTLSTDGTVAVTTVATTRDGARIVYGVSEAGSDWQVLRVRNVDDGSDLADQVRWIKFARTAWTHDAKGFFYGRYPEPAPGAELTEANRDQELRYHVLGDEQDSDRVVLKRPDQPEWGFDPQISDDGRYLIVEVTHGTDRRTRIYYADLGHPGSPHLDAPIVELLDAFDAAYHFVGNDGPVFYVRTDRDAERGRIVAIDTRKPSPSAWREVVPESEDVIADALLAGGKLVVRWMRDACAVLTVHTLEGAHLREIALPGLGAVDVISGRADSAELFFDFTSFLHPTTVLRHDLHSGATSTVFAPDLPLDFSAFETRQEFYQSKDGTRVPLFITGRKGLARDGSHPTYLYGYGGYGISITPMFSPSIATWIEIGGIFAVANIRGGGEYGEAWHQAGMLQRKQNVFDDFIAAAEHLIAEEYTRSERLAVAGGSNGGLLVGAVMTQRPELFGAAVPAVGVMDMLRYHKFTIGWAWIPEYGSADDPEMFPVLEAYSPLHNIREGTPYPATLIMTGDHDDRVVPAHSFKFAAALQAANGGPNPILIRVETRAGHGAGTPTDRVIAEQADKWAFLVKALGLGSGRD